VEWPDADDPAREVISYELASAILERETRGPARLTVLYDEACPMCRQLRAWLASQRVVVQLELLAAASPEARWRYPRLDHERTKAVLTVITQDGAVFEGERAWLVCAWALPRWQPLAEQLGTRPRLVLVRVASRLVNRHRLNHGRGRSYAGTCDAGCQSDATGWA
jgi:predicted DCC family thiol-disulfide oxidoreductase YuxK